MFTRLQIQSSSKFFKSSQEEANTTLPQAFGQNDSQAITRVYVQPDAWDKHQIRLLHERYQRFHKSSFKFSWMPFDDYSNYNHRDGGQHSLEDDVPVGTAGLW